MNDARPAMDPPSHGRDEAGPPLSPVDRSQGLGDLAPRTIYEPDSYNRTTEEAVRFLPIRKEGRLLGYLWASTSGDSAMWVDRKGAGVEGLNAGVSWIQRLREAKAEGLTALEALRKWVGAPEDPRAGAIPADAVERELPSLRALKEHAAGD